MTLLKSPDNSPLDASNHSEHPYKRSGLLRAVRAGGHAASGLRLAFVNESAFRQELVLCVIFLPLAFWLTVSSVERILLVGVTVLVLIVELLNSAVEAVVDRVGLELHPLSGQAKDMGSAAVMLSLLLWVFVWAQVLLFR